jgi:uncharacterized protein Yka (UPF0111/DUF47 family)
MVAAMTQTPFKPDPPLAGPAPPADPVSPSGASASKAAIASALGEGALALPALVQAGLQANDRAKYLLALLQAARAHADDPDQPFTGLRVEREGAGVTDESLDAVVAGARRGEGPDDYVIPGVDRLLGVLDEAVATMIEPVRVATSTREPAEELRARLEALRAGRPPTRSDHLSGRYLDAMTSAPAVQTAAPATQSAAPADSVHQLVMDAHRVLNRLQAAIASESLAGAAVYGLAEPDRPLVAAFMAGVADTAPVRLGHPGLGTTATRAGDRLLIQNDIGATAAHVVVIAVEGLRATVTYTDVHRQRLAFFQRMLATFPLVWSDEQVQGGGAALGAYHLVTGRYDAPDASALQTYLRHLGSRLAFLIDWNRARKRLVTLVPNAAAVDLLDWAAREGCGHMAFLALGAEELVYDAVELTGRRPARYGESLRDLLGLDTTVSVLRFALRASAEGLAAGKSSLLIRDQLRVEVLRNLRAALGRLVDAAAEHASLIVELARSLREELSWAGGAGPAQGDRLARAAERAGVWEHRADQIVMSARTSAGQLEGAADLVALFGVADDAADALEEATFQLTLLPSPAGQALPPSPACDELPPVVAQLAGLAVTAAREYLRAVLIGRDVLDRGDRADLEDFVVAVDRVVDLEHEADKAHRAARAATLAWAPEFRSLHVVDLMCGAVEDSTDALMRSALHLRETILDRVGAR